MHCTNRIGGILVCKKFREIITFSPRQLFAIFHPWWVDVWINMQHASLHYHLSMITWADIAWTTYLFAHPKNNQYIWQWSRFRLQMFSSRKSQTMKGPRTAPLPASSMSHISPISHLACLEMRHNRFCVVAVGLVATLSNISLICDSLLLFLLLLLYLPLVRLRCIWLSLWRTIPSRRDALAAGTVTVFIKSNRHGRDLCAF